MPGWTPSPPAHNSKLAYDLVAAVVVVSLQEKEVAAVRPEASGSQLGGSSGSGQRGGGSAG